MWVALGVGTGEALNEVAVSGCEWPSKLMPAVAECAAVAGRDAAHVDRMIEIKLHGCVRSTAQPRWAVRVRARHR